MTTATTTQNTPGIYEGLPFDAYQASDALSFSDLEAWVRGKPKNLGRRGLVPSVLHCLVLEGKDATAARYVKLDANYDLRMREGREAVAQVAAKTGKQPIKPTEWAEVVAMYKSIMACEDIRKALGRPSKREVCIRTQVEGYHTLTKARLDILCDDVIIDLKTTHCIDRDEFIDSIVQYNYAARAAFYIDNVAAVTGKYLPFEWICVSTRPPQYNTWRLRCSHEREAFGRKYYQTILRLYERYEKEHENE